MGCFGKQRVSKSEGHHLASAKSGPQKGIRRMTERVVKQRAKKIATSPVGMNTDLTCQNSWKALDLCKEIMLKGGWIVKQRAKKLTEHQIPIR